MMKFQNIPLNAARLKDGFLSERVRINHECTIPANIEKCHETGRFDAFKLNWKEGMPNKPHVYWDSDSAKVIEGMAYDLILHPDPAREKELDDLVDLIISAQQPDGYLNTHFTLVEPEKRWQCLHYAHELYCAGHLIEAAVAHFQATGKRNFLDCMCRYADYIATVFGHAPGQKRGYPGHEEIELALYKLADASGNPKYADLAKYFIDERGQEPNYFRGEKFTGELERLQAHKPVREQTEAVGHAVRAGYLYAGMADTAARYDDASLLDVCEKLWDNIVFKKMFITCGIGSTAEGEAFDLNYRLPNDTAYVESCAAIALTLFADRMLRMTGDGKYADVMERAIYNGTLSGIGLDGKTFLYVNKFEVNESTRWTGHTAPERRPWYDCSCCPTNFCRFIPQFGSFAVSTGEDNRTVRLNIPAAMDCTCGDFSFSVAGKYPYDGAVKIIIRSAGTASFAIRIPGWCRKYQLNLNGTPVTEQPDHGYVTLNRNWKVGDILELTLDMPVLCMRANPKVSADAGKFAIMRGPLVYALESVDNPNLQFSMLLADPNQKFELVPAKGLPAGTAAIAFSARKEIYQNSTDLYSTAPVTLSEPFKVTAIPYALWQNRGPVSEFAVWLRCSY